MNREIMEGDKFVIEVEHIMRAAKDGQGMLYFIKGFNTLVLDSYAMDKLERYEPGRPGLYEEGFKDGYDEGYGAGTNIGYRLGKSVGQKMADGSIDFEALGESLNKAMNDLRCAISEIVSNFMEEMADEK